MRFDYRWMLRCRQARSEAVLGYFDCRRGAACCALLGSDCLPGRSKQRPYATPYHTPRISKYPRSSPSLLGMPLIGTNLRHIMHIHPLLVREQLLDQRIEGFIWLDWV